MFRSDLLVTAVYIRVLTAVAPVFGLMTPLVPGTDLIATRVSGTGSSIIRSQGTLAVAFKVS